MKRPRLTSILCGSLAVLLTACGPAQAVGGWTSRLTTLAQVPTTTSDGLGRPAGWTEASHGEDSTPNYDVVFPQGSVNQLTIRISPESWAAMQANMTELYGEKGTRRQGGPPGGGQPQAGDPAQAGAAGPEQPVPAEGQPPMPLMPPGGQGAPGGPGGPGGGGFTTENPIWVAATIESNGQTWTNVGVRYKGNSSLMGSWGSGSPKLPFKLDFDELEDDHPEIKNQTFYGFDQLSLGNNWGDASGMRETIAYDLLDEAGLAAAETAFYEVVVDYGEGPVSLGIYTAVEAIDDTVIERVFGDDGGNIYEADGRAATLANGTLDQIEASFQKENNKKGDWSDVEALYAVLHSPERTTDPAAWRAKLEATFDVDTFLEWLAISGVIQHWDTYGAMTHNYYLYHDPATEKLTWISWDHNLVLGSGGGPGGGGPTGAPAANANRVERGRGPGRSTVSLDKQTVTEQWPLIRFLLDDPTYYATYVGYVEQTANELFVPERLTAKYQALAEVLMPYAAKEGKQAELEAAVHDLIAKTAERSKVASDFLSTQASAQPASVPTIQPEG
jgi:spore coat protein H